MSGYHDRVTTPRVTLPESVQISVKERRRFMFLHPIAYLESKRGAKLLDARVPDWHGRINIDTLCISEEKTCMLGQLFGTFSKGAAELKLSEFFDFSEHGFYCRPKLNAVYRTAWAIQIQGRR